MTECGVVGGVYASERWIILELLLVDGDVECGFWILV